MNAHSASCQAGHHLGKDNGGNDLSRSRWQWDGLVSKREFNCSFFFPNQIVTFSSPTHVPIPLLAPEMPTDGKAEEGLAELKIKGWVLPLFHSKVYSHRLL